MGLRALPWARFRVAGLAAVRKFWRPGAFKRGVLILLLVGSLKPGLARQDRQSETIVAESENFLIKRNALRSVEPIAQVRLFTSFGGPENI